MLLPVSTSNASAERMNRPPVSTPSESPGAAGRLWRLLTLLAVLLVALALRLWHLTQNGWGNEYYTAGVLSMTNNWRTSSQLLRSCRVCPVDKPQLPRLSSQRQAVRRPRPERPHTQVLEGFRVDCLSPRIAASAHRPRGSTFLPSRR
jgi:hypothetical protein